MTARTHACIGCSDAPGDTPFNKPRRTRHADQICPRCRLRGLYIPRRGPAMSRLVDPTEIEQKP